MKSISQTSFQSDTERAKFKAVIYGNILQNIRLLLKYVHDKALSFTSESNENASMCLLQLADADVVLKPVELLQGDVPQYVRSLLQEGAVKTALEHKNEIMLNDSAEYFFVSNCAL